MIIYSNNTGDNAYKGKAPHVKNRRFTDWVEKWAPGFTLQKHLPNRYASAGFSPLAYFTDFYVYERKG